MSLPPVGECPAWCELPAGHEWEDRWRDGLIRCHTYFRDVEGTKYQRIGIQEYEGENGQRMREVVLDVECPTNWDKATATKGLALITDVIALALPDWPTGEVR